MNLSFSIQIVANGYVVTVARSASVHAFGQTQLHVFNTSEETEAFVRQVAGDFKVNQVDEGQPMVNPAWHHAQDVALGHSVQTLGQTGAATWHQHTTPIGVPDDFGHPDAAPNQGPAPIAGNVFPHNQGN